MSRLRRTPAELQQFNKIVAEHIAEGYPDWYAKQIAWDVLLTERQIRKGNFRSKINA